MSTYHLKTDTGKFFNIEANNAGEAIGLALRKAKGCRIVECFVGNKEGRVNFDIPAHAPWVKKQKAKKPYQPTLF